MLRASILLSFALFGAPANADSLFAISCYGSWYEGSDPNSLPDRSERRTYVVDEERNTVGYWNQMREIVVPICDRTWESCEIEFEPTRITARGQLNRAGGTRLEINRRIGSIQHVWLGNDGRSAFYGDCDLVEVPRAMTEQNKF